MSVIEVTDGDLGALLARTGYWSRIAAVSRARAVE